MTQLLHRQRPLNILGIETTCDDSGVAIVNSQGKILSNCIESQVRQHLHNGGIIPIYAKELHIRNIDSVARLAFQQSQLSSIANNVEAIAVANRPGLKFSIQVGLNYARTLAKKYSKPLIPIHHMQAHALMPLVNRAHIKFPFIALLLSGGHSLIAIAERFDKFHLLGQSNDIALGELLEKYSRRLRLKDLGEPYDRIAGGASIELLANQSSIDHLKYFNVETSVPLSKYQNCDFSFSGYGGRIGLIGTHFDELWHGNRDSLLQELGDFCSSLQRVILIQIFRKLHRALIYYRHFWRFSNMDSYPNDDSVEHLGYKLRTKQESDSIDIVVSGGCSANQHFVGKIQEFVSSIDDNIRVYAPDRHLCSDNGAMIAWNGALRLKNYYENVERQKEYERNDLNDGVIFDSKQMDKISFMSKCDIGSNLRNNVSLLRIKVPRIELTDFKFPSRKKKDEPAA